MKSIPLVISCEHAVNFVPKEYEHLFSNEKEIPETHRGYDMGAKEIAEYLCDSFKVPLVTGTICRLMVDLNRSIKNPALFSSFSRNMSKNEKKYLLETWYFPYRREVESAIHKMIKKKGRAFHLSVHSFTPVLHGKVRSAEIGLLYDPSRTKEKELCSGWKRELMKVLPNMRVRCNYPYRGITDGFTVSLRKQFSSDHYVGVELEVNQGVTNNETLLKGLEQTIQAFSKYQV
ncbi:MAG: N-formylglutamate amidohydrolase [Nitrospinae bacterium]|nr:N-formylglutamate amidohydrolase [Nitrospinota bacterium]